jgi:hypothetical protein
MDLNDIRENLLGTWSGDNLLHLSWLTPTDYHSPTSLTVTPTVKDRFLLFNYTWSHENTPHEGLVLVGYDKNDNVVTASWVDSWHMSGKIMFCKGSLDANGTIDILGSYEAPPGPDWGWRITITHSTDQALQIIMHNVTPDGEEDLAVKAEYKRIG